MIPVCERAQLSQVVDLCAGIGAFSSLVHRLGFEVKLGIDHNKVWEQLFKTLHSQDTPFLVSDINSAQAIQALVHAGCFHSVMCGGISCNAYSVLGDQAGMSDPRSLSLPKALRTGYMLQSACIVLECTPALLKDVESQAIIRQFAETTGYRVSQCLIQLSNCWCARRERWFGLFCAPLIGHCNLFDLPQVSICPTVRSLMPEMKQWPPAEQQQLVLNLYEFAKYHVYSPGSIKSSHLRMDEQLPTLLHSAGNQLYDCACGCRPALSESRLQKRGLIGVLVPLGTSQTHMNMVMEHCRYLHPLEMWCLMGGLPHVDFGLGLRLAMSGIGQSVAPPVGLWIFAHIRRHLDSWLGVSPSVWPTVVLGSYLDEVKQQCAQLWAPSIPAAVPATVEDVAATTLRDDPIEDVALQLEVHLSMPCQSQAVVSIRCAPGTTVQQVIDAEKALGSLDFEPRATIANLPVDFSIPLDSGALLALCPAGSVESESGGGVPRCLAAVDLSHGPTSEVVPASSCVEPVSTLQVLHSKRQPAMSAEDRKAILEQQGPVWADDEVFSWLSNCAGNADVEQHVQVWDPLLISGLLQVRDSETWTSLISGLGPVATVVSAVVLNQHWCPLVWRIDMQGSKLFTGPIDDLHGETMRFLAEVIETHRGGAVGTWESKPLGFVNSRHCGAFVVMFVRHLLLWDRLPENQGQVDLFASQLHLGFAAQLIGLCSPPCLAAMGQVDLPVLQDLLLQHGVDAGEVSNRATSLVAAVGETQVIKAMAAQNPWRELKWCANQLRPPFMIVRPSELHEVVKQRGGKGHVGHKAHKHAKGQSKGVGKTGGGTAPNLDPTRLRLEHGLLHSLDGKPLQQISLPSVGSGVSGVVLTTMSLAEPYLRADRPISTGALGFFLIDTVSIPTTSLSCAVQPLPLVCSENSEPLLVDGVLMQMGAVSVVRPQLKPGSAVSSVSSVATCVVKAMIFRDMIDEAWDRVCAHPLQYIIKHVCPLQTCDDQECAGCEGWHPSKQFPLDSAIMEVWGRQWMRSTFAYCAPEDADLFAVHMRLPEILQVVVQEFSGMCGVFLEPKSVDGRRPSEVFQVVWLPKLSLSQVVVQRQTLPEVCGIARLGSKLGLRCRVADAEGVFAKVRPGHTFLPQGEKQTYLVGPMPFGTLKSSVAQALGELGWTVRPMQPVATSSHVQGLMFRVQAVQVPPKKVFSMSHGDVVVTKESVDVPPGAVRPQVVGTPATVSKASSEKQIDELQLNDPWAKPPQRVQKSSPATFHIGNPVEDMTQKVLAEVMSQLPKTSMEVDSEGTTEARVGFLEKQVQELHQQTQSLHTVVSQNAHDHGAQIQEVRTQLAQHCTHFEAALASQSSQMQSFQDAFQEQFRQQSAHQQTMLDSMFHKQMSQFESLLAKRHKPE